MGSVTKTQLSHCRIKEATDGIEDDYDGIPIKLYLQKLSRYQCGHQP